MKKIKRKQDRAFRLRRERATRRRNLARAIDLTLGSQRSHLFDAVRGTDRRTNPEFEARCVREYAEVNYTLSVELHELNKKDFKKEAFLPYPPI